MSSDESKATAMISIGSTDGAKPRSALLIDNSHSNKPISNKKQNLYLLLAAVILIAIIALIIIFMDIFSSSSSQSAQSVFDRYLIVISLDGFRSAYFNNPNISTPNLHKIAENGVYINRLIPVFPSLTFPNHYTIATGLYPGDHGIVSNSFWDPILQKPFYMSTNDQNGEFYRGIYTFCPNFFTFFLHTPKQGEPIWLTHKSKANEQRFANHKSATVFWVGSDHNCSGKGYPDYYLDYNGSYPFEKRVDTILDLLKNGSYRLIMGYFEQPDKDGHDYGPRSNEVRESVQNMDNVIGDLLNGIKNISMDLYDKTDIVIVSDHGMTNVSNQSVIFVNATNEFDLSDRTQFVLDSVSSNLFVKLTENCNFSIDEVKELLNDVISPIGLVNIYDRESIPFDYSSGYNERIPDIMVVGPVGYQFKFVSGMNNGWLSLKGNHGFDNLDVDMSAFMVAQGPSFKKGFVMQMVENIHLYELFCYVMDKMIPSPNNGSFDAISDILQLD